MKKFILLFLQANMGLFCAAGAMQLQFTYPSSVSTDQNGPLDLKAEVNFDTINKNAPIVVVMHGYSPSAGNFSDVRPNAQRLRDAGFFAISVAMRGREGSDGIRDSGGIEIYDIYDAVEAAKSRYAQYVNSDNISITGYSGGGGNVMSALTKFPDYFRVGSSFFGISDYGHNPQTGWYFCGAGTSHRAQLCVDVGDPTSGNPLILDRYAARNSTLAARNNPYAEIRLFVNHNETVCPPVHHDLYKSHAIAHAAYPGEFDNIHCHIGGYGEYVDFNNNGINDLNELQSWPHGFPNANQQFAAEAWYLERLQTGQILQPVLNNTDSLYVAGFVKTKRFSLWLGDGQNAAADLHYTLSPQEKTFSLHLLTSDRNVTGTLIVDVHDMAGKLVFVKLNDIIIDQFIAADSYTQHEFGDGQTLTLIDDEAMASISGDLNNDGVVDLEDFVILSRYWKAVHENGFESDVFDDEIGVEELYLLSENWLTGKRLRLFNAPLNSDLGWTREGQWQFGQPAGAGGVFHGNPDPTEGYCGPNVYGVNLQGDYSLQVGGPYRLTTGPIDCRGYKEISLRFARWLNTDDPYYVDNRIEASSDGIQWSQVWANQGQNPITDNAWTICDYDISAIADNNATVYIRWSYEILNIRVWPFSGWNIDAVQLWGKKK